MKMKINEQAAKETLYKAYEIAKTSESINCTHAQFIDFVLNNKHLTYKYILFTAILSAATDPNVNPLCLQAKSSLPGAYDARSICHSVVVKFEMGVLNKVLGGSNEPYLNKPARFPELSKNNAVRKGEDKIILDSLCDNLPLIASEDEAFACLVYLLHRLIEKRDSQIKLMEIKVIHDQNKAKLLKYIYKLLSVSIEGEMLTLTVAGLYHLLFINDANYIVEVHPVNQSGASGKEISDLDVYNGSALYVANELKDKPFENTDIKHAADKVIEAGGSQLLFIVGPRGNNDFTTADSLVNEYLERGFFLRVLSIHSFVDMILTLIEDADAEKYIQYMVSKALTTKFKEDTVLHILKTAKAYFDIDFN